LSTTTFLADEGRTVKNEPLPDGYVVHLPQLRPPPHQFGACVSVDANPALDRQQQTERTCKVCGAVKVTVHAGNKHWREWRLSDSGAQREMADPVCGAKGQG
jgi:hypothetical protein